jgi:alpha-mannosidase
MWVEALSEVVLLTTKFATTVIFGQRYFRSRFGKLCETFWLPDSFGYASQLPQLARWAGMNHFFTQKLSWSQFNDCECFRGS